VELRLGGVVEARPVRSMRLDEGNEDLSHIVEDEAAGEAGRLGWAGRTSRSARRSGEEGDKSDLVFPGKRGGGIGGRGKRRVILSAEGGNKGEPKVMPEEAGEDK
jgi:hypothetical protein